MTDIHSTCNKCHTCSPTHGAHFISFFSSSSSSSLLLFFSSSPCSSGDFSACLSITAAIVSLSPPVEAITAPAALEVANQSPNSFNHPDMNLLRSRSPPAQNNPSAGLQIGSSRSSDKMFSVVKEQNNSRHFGPDDFLKHSES